ncbi:hypothetical protein ACHAXS_013218 [Conticribra weissflogii]
MRTSTPETENQGDRRRRPPKPSKSQSSSTSSSYGSVDTHPAGNNNNNGGGGSDRKEDFQSSTWRKKDETVTGSNCYRKSYQRPREETDDDDDDRDDCNHDDYDHEFLPVTRSPLFQNCTTAVTVFVLSLLLVGCWSQLDPMAHDFDGTSSGGLNVHGVNLDTKMKMNWNENENNIANANFHGNVDSSSPAAASTSAVTSSERNSASSASFLRKDIHQNESQLSLQLPLQLQLVQRENIPNSSSSINLEQPSATADVFRNHTKFYHTYPRRPFLTHHRPPDDPITLPILGFPSLSLAIYPDPSSQQPLADRAVRRAVETLSLSYFDVAPEYGDGVAQSRLGPALRPYRSRVFLAAKTMYRTALEAEIDLDNTLAALQTDHLDLYQFHSLSTLEEVDAILAPGGAMETFLQAKADGRIGAIGFSAHDEQTAVKMIRTGLVDSCMFPINFAAYHYGNVGKRVLDAAVEHGVGVIALKSGAKGRLTNETGSPVRVPPEGGFRHIPEWKREEMLRFPVMTSKDHPTEWYEPEEDEEYLMKLVVWSLNQKGVAAVLPPGDLGIFDKVARGLLRMCGCFRVVNGVDFGGDGKCRVPELSDEDIEDMMERYKDVKPIFYDWDVSGSKVST